MTLFNMIGYELKKLFTRQKEIYIALVICTILFVIISRSFDDSYILTSFWRDLIQIIPWAGYFMIAAMIVVGTARVMPVEQEQRMTELLVTYPKGRLHLVVAKQIVVFLYCLLVTLYFHMVAFLVLLTKYEFTGAFTRIIEQRVHNVPTPNEQLFFVEMFAYEIIYLTLASYVFALFIFSLSLFIQRSALVMITAGSLFLFGELTYRFYFLSESQIGVLFNYIYRFGFSGMLSFHYLEDYAGEDSFFSMSGVLLFFILLSGLLFVLNLRIGRRQAYVAMGN